jgi:hypothetical protein
VSCMIPIDSYQSLPPRLGLLSKEFAAMVRYGRKALSTYLASRLIVVWCVLEMGKHVECDCKVPKRPADSALIVVAEVSVMG